MKLKVKCRNWTTECNFSVNLVYKKELNLILKVSETSSQGAVDLSLRGTDFFLPILYDPSNKCHG